MPFASLIGAELVSASPEEVRGRLDWTPERCTTGGVLHGGVLMSLADSIGAYCAALNLPAGAGTATIESTTNLFRAVREGYVEAVPPPLHRRRAVLLVQTRLLGSQRRRRPRATHRPDRGPTAP